jgi:hypothetical protein
VCAALAQAGAAPPGRTDGDVDGTEAAAAADQPGPAAAAVPPAQGPRGLAAETVDLTAADEEPDSVPPPQAPQPEAPRSPLEGEGRPRGKQGGEPPINGARPHQLHGGGAGSAVLLDLLRRQVAAGRLAAAAQGEADGSVHAAQYAAYPSDVAVKLEPGVGMAHGPHGGGSGGGGGGLSQGLLRALLAQGHLAEQQRHGAAREALAAAVHAAHAHAGGGGGGHGGGAAHERPGLSQAALLQLYAQQHQQQQQQTASQQGQLEAQRAAHAQHAAARHEPPAQHAQHGAGSGRGGHGAKGPTGLSVLRSLAAARAAQGGDGLLDPAAMHALDDAAARRAHHAASLPAAKRVRLDAAEAAQHAAAQHAAAQHAQHAALAHHVQQLLALQAAGVPLSPPQRALLEVLQHGGAAAASVARLTSALPQQRAGGYGGALGRGGAGGHGGLMGLHAMPHDGVSAETAARAARRAQRSTTRWLARGARCWDPGARARVGRRRRRPQRRTQEKPRVRGCERLPLTPCIRLPTLLLHRRSRWRWACRCPRACAPFAARDQPRGGRWRSSRPN